MKKYIYVQDHQMYYESIIRFQSEQEIPQSILDECSKSNGRLSQSFNEFSENLGKKGYKIRPIHIDYQELFDGFIFCPVIFGATGNY